MQKSKESGKKQKFTPRSSSGSGFSREDEMGSNKKKLRKEKQNEIEDNYSDDYSYENDKDVEMVKKVNKKVDKNETSKLSNEIKKNSYDNEASQNEIEDNYEFKF
mmetsp:Transcript_25444/g.22609  ORF Transcript_25444/g.22609 Transcript_25444/m.22609 type:complete len:105 (+) Transcript_25444:426-740(+)